MKMVHFVDKGKIAKIELHYGLRKYISSVLDICYATSEILWYYINK